eukprot:m.278717 g.278717  ORF g.278717 m.278717 type:complete len:70 (+) comp26956_c0_seq5:151-360(+)
MVGVTGELERSRSQLYTVGVLPMLPAIHTPKMHQEEVRASHPSILPPCALAHLCVGCPFVLECHLIADT